MREVRRGLARGRLLPRVPRGHAQLRTARWGSLKKGGFLVAMEAGSRIVPVALAGTHELMPKGGFRIRSGRVTVKVLGAVDASAYGVEDRDRLVSEVRGRIAAALA